MQNVRSTLKPYNGLDSLINAYFRVTEAWCMLYTDQILHQCQNIHVQWITKLVQGLICGYGFDVRMASVAKRD